MDLIQMAIKMETEAINFYEEAATKMRHPVGSKMFLTIAEDERRHLEMLSKIIREMDIGLETKSPMENIRTVFETMKDKMMQRIEATDDELEAFKVAMQMEKHGIEFYQKAKSQLQTDRERILLERLIKEEQEHYEIFSNTYSFLSDTGNWFMWQEHSTVDGGTPWA